VYRGSQTDEEASMEERGVHQLSQREGSTGDVTRISTILALSKRGNMPPLDPLSVRLAIYKEVNELSIPLHKQILGRIQGISHFFNQEKYGTSLGSIDKSENRP
jgi:hypothetical protein